MKKNDKSSQIKGGKRILIASLSLSFLVLGYLFFATIAGHVMSIVLMILLLSALLLYFFSKVDWLVVVANGMSNLIMFFYFIFADSSSHEIAISGQGCLDVCLGEAFLFHIMKVFAEPAIFLSFFVIIVWLRESKIINETLYRLLSVLTLVFGAIIFFVFLLTF